MSVLQIDWKTPFKPREVFGRPLRVVEHDRRMRNLPEYVDLSHFALVTRQREGESSMDGEERICRLKDRPSLIRIGAPLWLAFREMTPTTSSKPNRPVAFPEAWRRDPYGRSLTIHCDGTVLADPRGHRYGLFIASADGQIVCGTYWMGHQRFVTDLSLVY